MASRVTTHIRQSLMATLQPSTDSGSVEHGEPWEVQLGSGTGAYQADRVYAVDLSVGTGGTEVDLQTATDAYGVALSLDEVVSFQFVADEDNTAAVNITGGASNKWEAFLLATGDGVKLPAGARMQYTAPLDGSLPVSASAKTIKFAAASGTQDISILIVGRSQ